jgi:hypothetical protein
MNGMGVIITRTDFLLPRITGIFPLPLRERAGVRGTDYHHLSSPQGRGLDEEGRITASLERWVYHPTSADQPQTPTKATDFEANPPTKPTIPAKPLPRNGYIKRYHDAEAVAPLQIVTRGTDHHYYVKITDWDTDKTIATIFIRAGRSIQTEVPLGSYRLKYATGTTWYGQNYLFGDETVYSTADARFDFAAKGDQVSGYTVELYLQQHGNLRTKNLKASEW